LFNVNWLGELVQKEVSPSDTVLDIGCGRMYSITNLYPHYKPTTLKSKSIVGVDINKCSLTFVKERIRSTLFNMVQHDLTKTLPFQDKSFDVVLLLDILEHLKLEDAIKLLYESTRVAKRKIIAFTPAAFTRNVENAIRMENPLQEHRCLFPKDVFFKNLFRVFKITDADNGKNVYWYAVKTKPYRILHIWDQAGVASLIARTQRAHGFKSEVYLLKIHDGYGISQFYGARLLDDTTFYNGLKTARAVGKTKLGSILYSFFRVFRNIRAVLRIRSLARECDIIHIHSIYYVFPFLPRKPRVIEFHGDDVRTTLTDRRKPISKYMKLLAKIFVKIFWRTEHFIVSTPDLLKDVPHSAWLPNPVDISLFHTNTHTHTHLHPRAVYFHNWYETGVSARVIAEKHGFDLTVKDRLNGFIPYKEMPRFLGGFEFYIDRYMIHSLSKTALESLALGLKVVRFDGTILEGLPAYHTPNNVFEKLNRIYEKVLN